MQRHDLGMGSPRWADSSPVVVVNELRVWEVHATRCYDSIEDARVAYELYLKAIELRDGRLANFLQECMLMELHESGSFA